MYGFCGFGSAYFCASQKVMLLLSFPSIVKKGLSEKGDSIKQGGFIKNR